MRATGIICEYNPFHNGHRYHIEKTREAVGDDVIVCVMSGNYVQRGEPAIIDKWERAKAAVLSGADLVVELPVPFSNENSAIFSFGAVSILESLGVSQISFGSESGNGEKITKLADYISDDFETIEAEIRAKVKEGYSYPRARAEVINKHTDYEFEDILSNSNDILALEYIINMKIASPVFIKRKGSQYNDLSLSDVFSSATSIREAIYNGNDISGQLPSDEYKAIKNRLSKSFANNVNSSNFGTCFIPVKPFDKLFQTFRYKVLSSTEEELNLIFGAEEGLGSLIKKQIRFCNSYDDVVNALKSKRYTNTRIKRVILNTILGITKDEIKNANLYVHVLSFNEKGSAYLKQIKREKQDLVFIDNYNKAMNNYPELKSMLELNILATDIYNHIMGYDLYAYSEYVKKALKY